MQRTPMAPHRTLLQEAQPDVAPVPLQGGPEATPAIPMWVLAAVLTTGVVLCATILALLVCAWRLRRRPQPPEERLISDSSRRISMLKAQHAAAGAAPRTADHELSSRTLSSPSHNVALDAICDPFMLDDLLPVTVNLMVARNPSFEPAEELGTMSVGRELHMSTAASDDVHSLHTVAAAVAAAAKRGSIASDEVSSSGERLGSYDVAPPGSQNSALEVQGAMQGGDDVTVDVSAAYQSSPLGAVRTGTWRGLRVALVDIQSSGRTEEYSMALAASEAATSANLMHDGVVATYYHVIAQPKLQHAPEFKLRLVTELCNGGTMAEALEDDMYAVAQPLQWQRIMCTLRHLAAAMAYVHSKRICHGDLRPENIHFSYDPEVYCGVDDALEHGGAVPKVANAGFASLLQRRRLDLADDAFCHQYAAPEAGPRHMLRQPADVYSFGILMWVLIIGGHEPLPQAKHEHVKSNRCLPKLRGVVPLTYTLTIKACLSSDASERPTFAQLEELLADMRAEVRSGQYITSKGHISASSAIDASRPGEEPACAPRLSLEGSEAHLGYSLFGGIMPSTIAEGDEQASSSMPDSRALSGDEAGAAGDAHAHNLGSGRSQASPAGAGASRRHVFQPREASLEGERPYALAAGGPGSGRRTPPGSASTHCSQDGGQEYADGVGGLLPAPSSRESQLDSLGGSALLPTWRAPASHRLG